MRDQRDLVSHDHSLRETSDVAGQGQIYPVVEDLGAQGRGHLDLGEASLVERKDMYVVLHLVASDRGGCKEPEHGLTLCHVERKFLTYPSIIILVQKTN